MESRQQEFKRRHTLCLVTHQKEQPKIEFKIDENALSEEDPDISSDEELVAYQKELRTPGLRICTVNEDEDEVEICQFDNFNQHDKMDNSPQVGLLPAGVEDRVSRKVQEQIMNSPQLFGSKASLGARLSLQGATKNLIGVKEKSIAEESSSSSSQENNSPKPKVEQKSTETKPKKEKKNPLAKKVTPTDLKKIVEQMFGMIDTNQNGLLEENELLTFFKQGSQNHGATFDPQEFQRSWNKMSKEGTQGINQEVFYQYMLEKAKKDGQLIEEQK